LEDVLTHTAVGIAQVDFSETGTLVFTAGGSFKPDRFAAMVDRTGSATSLTNDREQFLEPSSGPRGQRIAVSINAANDDIWILDRQQRLLSRFTPGDGDHRYPIWTPDDKRIVFAWGRGEAYGIFWKDAEGVGEAEQLVAPKNQQYPGSISPDGKLLAFWETNPATSRDIWLLPLQGERKPQRFAVTPFDEWAPKFSPNGQWIAYTSNESGRPEIYVQAVQSGGAKHRISSGGGAWPVWSPDGRELFFLNDANLMVGKMDPNSGTAFDVSRLFSIPNLLQTPTSPEYDITPDGKNFVMILQNEKSPPTQLNVIFNWFSELQQRAAAK
jgi:Tol biopolymer transport system component